MPRPRFVKLPPTQQQSILAAATEEFATYGFRDASLNRIIGAAGLSKGSMYYYFDGKEDLYGHVIRAQLEELFRTGGPFPVPEVRDPDAFWEALTEDYLRLMQMLTASPQIAALLRDWMTGPTAPPLRAALDDAEQDVQPWLSRTLAVGQRIGAVRTDVPDDLILAVVVSMGQALDMWLIKNAEQGAEVADLVGPTLAMLRRAVAPDPS